jgi:hypothetical protein
VPVHNIEDEIPDVIPVPLGQWTDRVRYKDDGRHSYAYRPGRVLVFEEGAWNEAQQLLQRADPPDDASWLGFRLLEVDEGREDWLVASLRTRGFTAERDYVLFADGVESNPAWANPAWANPAWANPAWANPAWANPAWANPAWANPVPLSLTYPSPMFTSEAIGYLYRTSGARMSNARSARMEELGLPSPNPYVGPLHPPQVIVLDTGLAWNAEIDGALVNELPPFLARLGEPPVIDIDFPDPDGNGHLDPVSGHGTFIAGIVERMVPGCRLAVARVLTTYGDGSVAEINSRLAHIAKHGIDVAGGAGGGYHVTVDGNTIINLSFSGYSPEEMQVLATTIRQIRQETRDTFGSPAVFVASAGNDATTRPAYPACLDEVVGVGAVGAYGPAAFTNAGPWVNACAPGVDVVSSMFLNFAGPIPEKMMWPDPDNFEGWARWSGTSFAAPVVVGALAREMLRTGCSAQDAVSSVIDAPWALRIPGLGTVVNET